MILEIIFDLIFFVGFLLALRGYQLLYRGMFSTYGDPVAFKRGVVMMMIGIVVMLGTEVITSFTA